MARFQNIWFVVVSIYHDCLLVFQHLSISNPANTHCTVSTSPQPGHHSGSAWVVSWSACHWSLLAIWPLLSEQTILPTPDGDTLGRISCLEAEDTDQACRMSLPLTHDQLSKMNQSEISVTTTDQSEAYLHQNLWSSVSCKLEIMKSDYIWPGILQLCHVVKHTLVNWIMESGSCKNHQS